MFAIIMIITWIMAFMGAYLVYNKLFTILNDSTERLLFYLIDALCIGIFLFIIARKQFDSLCLDFLDMFHCSMDLCRDRV